jgi:hypothetical protein
MTKIKKIKTNKIYPSRAYDVFHPSSVHKSSHSITNITHAHLTISFYNKHKGTYPQ